MKPIALGGLPLYGDNFLRIVYLDAAGLSKKEDEPLTVVAGVIVHPDKQWRAINTYLSNLADEYVGRPRRFDFYFHAHEIFHGTNTLHRDKYDKETRFRILDRLVAIPKLFDSPIVWGYAPRKLFDSDENRPPPHITQNAASCSLAFCAAALATEHWMRSVADRDEIAMVVMENDEQYRRLINQTHRTLSDPKLKHSLQVRGASDLGIHRIIYPVHFEEKTDSNALQIADVCAFAIKRYLVNASQCDRFYQPLVSNLVNHLQVDRETLIMDVVSE
jgi:hypothetical protein